MSGVFGGGHSVKQSDTKLAGIQIQTSCYGGAVALVYGTDRIAANLIHYLDFKAIPHTKKQKMGKGGGGSMSSTTYTYEAMILLAICEGVASVNRVWKDKSVTSLAGLGFTFFSGSRTQAPWAYLTSKHPAEAVGYAGTAYAAHAAYELDGNASLENHSFEVTGFCVVGGGNLDAHPADIVPHYLSDPLVGAGWDASRLGDLALYRTYCTAAGLWLSPSWSEQGEAKRGLEEIFTATNSEPVWSEGKLKVIPYGDTPLTGNGVTYTPNTTPVYDLTLDDFLAEGDEDPIQVERTSTQDAYNCVPVKFRDRALEYNENTLDDPDPVDVETFGLRKAEAKDLPCIKRAAVALTISRILAQRSVYCRNRYRFRLGWRYCLLEPMDLVTLTAPYLGLDHRPVRLLEIEENEQGDLDVTAEEWPFGVASHTRYTVQSADGQAPDVNADPGDAAAVLFDVPALYWASEGPEVMIAAAGGPLWGGCEVWVSADGNTYAYAGSITSKARFGVLSAALPAAVVGLDTTNTLAVDLTASGGQLQSVDAQSAADLLDLCWVSGEMLAYQTATLTAASKYNLTRLQRGAYGTAAGGHLVGDKFVRIDDAVFRYPVPASRVGQQLSVKLVSVNIWGGGRQDPSTVPVYTFTPAATTLPAPTNVAISISDTRPA